MRDLLGWLVACCMLLAGCATPQLARLSPAEAGLPTSAELRGVPFLAQEEFQCGPASLAMVARFAGLDLSPEALKPQVYLPERQGSLQIEMLAAARRQGLAALVIEPELAALLKQVATGQPVVVLQNLSLPWVPLWHYAVVIGYDLQAQTVTLHSGLNERMSMPLSTFERTWARGRHWAMVVASPDWPPDVPARSWLQAASSLERVQPAAAARAFAAATRR